MRVCDSNTPRDFLSFIFSGSVGQTTAAIIQPAAFPPPPPRLLFIFIQRASSFDEKLRTLLYLSSVNKTSVVY
jgi:hypothetical protein